MIKITIEGETGAEVASKLQGLMDAFSGTAAPAPAETPAAEPKKTTRAKADKKAEPEVKEEPEQEAVEQTAEDVAEVSKDEKETALDIDTMRSYALGYVNAAADDQAKRRELFQEILKQFDVAKFNDIPVAKLAAAKTFIDGKRAALGLDVE